MRPLTHAVATTLAPHNHKPYCNEDQRVWRPVVTRMAWSGPGNPRGWGAIRLRA